MKTNSPAKTGIYGLIIAEIILGGILFLYGSMTIISYQKKTHELKTQIVQCDKIRNELDRTNRGYQAKISQLLQPSVVAARVMNSMTTKAEIVVVSNADLRRGYVVLNPSNAGSRVAQNVRNNINSARN